MEIRFTLKEESKLAQEEAFLNLSKSERFYRFLELMRYYNTFSTKKKKDKNNNFNIVIKVN